MTPEQDAPRRHTMKCKAVLFIYADPSSSEGLGRVFNALIAARELKDAGDDVRIIFDGAGTHCVTELSQPDHKAHMLYESVKDRVAGACGFCAGIFGAQPALERTKTRAIVEYEGHPSFRRLLLEGYQILTF